jgi:hypothetical protein
VQDAQQHQRGRLGEVEGPRRLSEDRLRVAQVAVDVVASAFGVLVSSARACASTSGSLSTYTIRERGATRLGHLMGIVRGRQPGPDVQELVDAFLAGQVPDRPPQNARSARAESWLTLMPFARRSQSASRLLDQCVTPWPRSESGGGVTVAARISHTTASVSTVFGPPGRGASSSPASPDSAYWRRHLTTVRLGAPGPPGDLRAGQPVRGQQHDPGPLHHPGRGPLRPGPPLQLRPVSIRHRQDAHAIRHASLSRILTES